MLVAPGLRLLLLLSLPVNAFEFRLARGEWLLRRFWYPESSHGMGGAVIVFVLIVAEVGGVPLLRDWFCSQGADLG